ncbi:MAG: NADH-quinone oxidoreductase subunit J [Anaerolineae bacterium]
MTDFEPSLLASVPHIVFLTVSAVTLLGAIAMVTVRSIVYAALMMILSFAGVAGIYVLLEAPFLAAVQVLIYVGAISVLFLFGIMLTQRSAEGPGRFRNQQWAYVFGAVTILAAVFPLLLVRADWVLSDATPVADPVLGLGEALLTTYVLPFEVASVLLLMALVGAIIIAREGVTEREES